MTEERFTAEMLVHYAARRRGVTIEDFGVAPVVVLSWATRTVQSLAAATGAQQPPHWMYGEQYPLYTGSVEGHRVSFTRVPIGAPATIVRMEEMIACGARVFLGLGNAGGLQPETPVGTCLIPTACVREEGTSAHYVNPDADVRPSLRLTEVMRTACQSEGIEVLAGPVWTTDAPYRELVSKIEAYRRQGVLGVDMETSAMYALGQVRGADVCNLLVVSDELWREWHPAFGQPTLLEAMQRAERAILRCISLGLVQ
ncbi:MAG TPA: nucleoside phosphorylase [bacterium]|nr:nucleoside phosphorylase [bacterium]